MYITCLPVRVGTQESIWPLMERRRQARLSAPHPRRHHRHGCIVSPQAPRGACAFAAPPFPAPLSLWRPASRSLSRPALRVQPPVLDALSARLPACLPACSEARGRDSGCSFAWPQLDGRPSEAKRMGKGEKQLAAVAVQHSTAQHRQLSRPSPAERSVHKSAPLPVESAPLPLLQLVRLPSGRRTSRSALGLVSRPNQPLPPPTAREPVTVAVPSSA